MTDNRSELYQQVILEHNKNPRNFKVLNPASHTAEGYNPLCGDHLNVYLNIKDGKIEEITFHGDGCAMAREAELYQSETGARAWAAPQSSVSR